VIGLEQVQGPLLLRTTGEGWLNTRSQPQVPIEMSLAQHCFFARCLQPLFSKLADRFQQAIALSAAFDQNEGLVDQRRQQVEDVLLRNAFTGRDVFGRFQSESAREDRKA
jgi:hypothetical protein